MDTATHPPTLAEQIRRVEQCAAAVQRALRDCATKRGPLIDGPAINPDEDTSDPAWCLAVEATCLVREVRALVGKPPRREYYG